MPDLIINREIEIIHRNVELLLKNNFQSILGYINFTTLSGIPIADANISINLYENESLIDTFYCLSDDGWIVNLNAGNYTAVFDVENEGYNVDAVSAALTIISSDSTDNGTVPDGDSDDNGADSPVDNEIIPDVSSIDNEVTLATSAGYDNHNTQSNRQLRLTRHLTTD